MACQVREVVIACLQLDGTGGTLIIHFEVKSIHAWMAAGEKLTDLSGGSEILEELVTLEGGLLGKALDACGIAREAVVVNAASRIQLNLKDENAANAFCELWPLVIETVAPGLDFALSREKSTDPNDDGAIGEITSPQALIGPLSFTAPRTGKVASHLTVGESKEYLDRGSQQRRLTGNRVKKGELNKSLLFSKLQLPNAQGYTLYPIQDADVLSVGQGRRGLAYVYADGSGIGSIINNLNEKLEGSDAFKNAAKRAFSLALDEATFNSVRYALKEISQSTDGAVEIRPVMIGGDDMCVILNGRQGHAFAASYLRKFKQESALIAARMVTALEEKKLEVSKDAFANVIPDEIRLGCGVAYVHPHFPASKALELAEQLCVWSKQVVCRYTSALAFYRVTGSTIRSFDDVWAQDLTQGEHTISAGPYLLDDISKQTSPLQASGKTPADVSPEFAKDALQKYMTIEQLDGLLLALTDPAMPSGPQHKILDLAHLSLADANAKLHRMFEIARADQNKAYGTAMEKLQEALRLAQLKNENTVGVSIEREIGFNEAGHDFRLRRGSSQKATPFGDIHALISAANEPGETDKTPVLVDWEQDV